MKARRYFKKAIMAFVICFLNTLTSCTATPQENTNTKPIKDRILPTIKYNGPTTIKKGTSYDITDYLEVYEMKDGQKRSYKYVGEGLYFPQEMEYMVTVDCGDGKETCEFSTDVLDVYEFSVDAGSSDLLYLQSKVDVKVEE